MYNNLEELQEQRRQLNASLKTKEKEIADQWHSLFVQEEKSPFMTPTQKLLSYANTGAGLLDGALFGWKIYRRFFGNRRRK